MFIHVLFYLFLAIGFLIYQSNPIYIITAVICANIYIVGDIILKDIKKINKERSDV